MRRTLLLAVVFAGGVVPARAGAAPFRGSESRAVDDGKAPPRTRTLRKARARALDAALEAIGGQVEIDPQARKRVRSQASAWTGAYRLLVERVDAGELTIEVEVEIDLPRLRKAVSRRAVAQVRGVAWGGLSGVHGCPQGSTLGFDDDGIRSTLEARGVLVPDAAAAVTVGLRCADMGRVPHTHLVAARVDVAADDGLHGAFEHAGVGFGETPAEALDAARSDALDATATTLSARARADVVLRVRASSGPAARVRRLEKSLRESLLGVTDAAVSGIESDGTVRIDVRGTVDATRLAAQLEELSFPDFVVVVEAMDDPETVDVRLASPMAPAP